MLLFFKISIESIVIPRLSSMTLTIFVFFLISVARVFPTLLIFQCFLSVVFLSLKIIIIFNKNIIIIINKKYY